MPLLESSPEPGYSSLLGKSVAPLPLTQSSSVSHSRTFGTAVSGKIPSGFDDVVFSGTDHFTTWRKTGPDATLQHIVDVQKALAENHEATA